MAKGDDDRHHRDLQPERASEPSLGVVGERQVAGDGSGRQVAPASFQSDGDGTPDQEDHHHHGRDLHDAQSSAARFMHAPDILPPEVNGDQHAQSRREGVHLHSRGLVQHFEDLIEQRTQILARADHADGSGQDVIEDQGRYGQFGKNWSHAVPDHDVTRYRRALVSAIPISRYTLRTAKLNSMTPRTNHGADLPMACSAAPPA